jgi:hydantoinase/carbamoylase family amidase
LERKEDHAVVKLERVREELGALAKIGATEEGGATRLAWTPEEREAHDLAAHWMREAGLKVWVDTAGNSFGRWEGQDAHAPTIMLGSHLDTVDNGGNFDGTLGFVSSLEAVRSLMEEGYSPLHPLTVAVFSAEEAARFADTCLGSKIITGRMDTEGLRLLKDRGGVTADEAMRSIGLDPDRVGEARWAPEQIAAYLELHIEQSTVLESLGAEIGVVTAIAAATRYRATLEGVASHSGATPMGGRKDALVAAAEIVLGVERIASQEAGPTTVGTVGTLTIRPGALTVVPGWAQLGIDIRDTVAADKRAAAERVEAMIRDVCDRRSIALDLKLLLDDQPEQMSPLLQDAIRTAAEKLGYRNHSMPSAAGHDARIMASVTPSGLIFVPSRDGISHSPREWTAPEHVEAGVRTFKESVRVADGRLSEARAREA